MTSRRAVTALVSVVDEELCGDFVCEYGPEYYVFPFHLL